jgi:hypothetical protein
MQHLKNNINLSTIDEKLLRHPGLVAKDARLRKQRQRAKTPPNFGGCPIVARKILDRQRQKNGARKIKGNRRIPPMNS